MHSEPLTAATTAPDRTLPEWTESFTMRRFALLLGLLIVASFAAVLFGGESFFLRDFGYFSYPIAHYHRECFWRGELFPLWNPYSSCGTPFLAEWNTLVLYPPALIYLLLPLPWSLNFFCLLHLFVAGLGMYALARDWTGNRFAASVAGILFVFNGFTLNGLMWPHIIAALGALPWIVLTARRAWLIGGRAIFTALIPATLQMLTGAPEIILITWLFVGGVWIVDAFKNRPVRTRGLARLLLVVLFVAGISAAQLLPFFQLAAASDRGVSSVGSAWSMPSWGWASLFVPLFHSYRAPLGVFFQTDQYWISSYYPGAGGLLLAIFALLKARDGRVWMLFALACAGLLLALGENGFVYPFIRAIAPQLSLVRFPVKFVVALIIAVPMLAAFGVRAWTESTAPHPQRTALFLLAFGMLCVIAGIVWWDRAHLAPSEIWSDTMWSGSSRALLMVILALALATLVRSARTQKRFVVSVAVLVILFIDGKTHSPNANATIPSAALQPGLMTWEPPPSIQGPRAMLTRAARDEVANRMFSDPAKDYLLHRQALAANCNLLEKIPNVAGFYPLYLRFQREAWSQFFFTQTNVIAAPFLDFLGVAHINTPGSPFDWTHRTTALPLVTVGQQSLFADTTNILRALVAPTFDPLRSVYLPLEAQPLVSVTHQTDARILSQQFQTHRLHFTVEAKENSLLVVAQSFYSPWRALVDGAATTILRANHGFQAVAVPSGTHNVVFSYEDRAFRFGAIISLVSLAFAAALAVWSPRWL